MNKKRYLAIFLVLVLSVFLITATLVNKNTNKWESSDNVSFSITGFDGNLTGAMENDLFRTQIISILDSSATNEGHNLSEIWVSVDNVGMTFKDAIETNKLCGIIDDTLNNSNAPDPSHLGTEIEISSGISLQDAINDGTLVNVSGGWSDWGECSAACGGTQSRTCTNPPPICGGPDCSNLDGGLDTQDCAPCFPPSNVGLTSKNFYTGMRTSHGVYYKIGCLDVGIDCSAGEPCTINWRRVGSDYPDSWARCSQNFGTNTISKGQIISTPECVKVGGGLRLYYSCTVNWDSSDNKIKVYGKTRTYGVRSGTYYGYYTIQLDGSVMNRVVWYVL